MKLGYARVSTAPADRQDQNLAIQLDALNAAGCSKIFQEKARGSKTERPELNRLLEIIREGDTLMIWKLDGADRPATGPFPESLDRDCHSARRATRWLSQFERTD